MGFFVIKHKMCFRIYFKGGMLNDKHRLTCTCVVSLEIW